MCYSIEHFLELMFLRSDTNMLVLSSLPIFPEGSPLSPEIMDITRKTVEGLCRDERILLHAQALPNVGTQRAALDAMEHTAEPLPGRGVEDVHPFPGRLRGRRERLVARRSRRRQPGGAVHPQGRGPRHPDDLHPQGTLARERERLADDIGPAARRHPDVNFVAYHSGFEAGTTEGPVHAGDERTSA